MQARHILTVVLLMTAISGEVKAQECTATPVTVFFVNGVNNDESEAEISRGELETRLSTHVEGTAVQSACLQFGLAFNENESFWLVGDLFEARAQLLAGKVSRFFWRVWANLDLAPDLFQEFFEEFVQSIDLFTYVLQGDLQEHVVQYSKELGDGREVILVPHSQGNLYANQAYDRIADCCPNLISKLHIVAVATPESFVADGPPYTYTTLFDDAIATVLFARVNPSRLTPNTINNFPVACGSPFRCHSFVDSYLAGRVSGPQILNQIVAAIPSTPTPPGGPINFKPKQDVATGRNPMGLAIEDFNRDGKPDLAVANGGTLSCAFCGNTASVLLGNGDGTFMTKPDLTTGSQPWDVATGDLDGDGESDVVVSNHVSRTLSVFFGDGTGLFEPIPPLLTVPVGNGPRSVVIRDFDGDGWLDVAVASDDVTRAGKISVFLRDGNRSFQARADYLTGVFGSRGLAAADIDGNGSLDLVASNAGSFNGSVSVLLGSGTGSFSLSPIVSPTMGSDSVFVALGDLDLDGNTDAVVANRLSEDMSILRGDGTESFEVFDMLTAGSNPQSVALGDLNLDGRLDLVVTNNGSANISVFEGDGAGGFSFVGDFDTDVGPFGVVIGDLNGDGKPDLAVTNNDAHSVSILLAE